MYFLNKYTFFLFSVSGQWLTVHLNLGM